VTAQRWYWDGLGKAEQVRAIVIRGALMGDEEILAAIKESIATVTGLNPDHLPGSASYENDLGLDSITFLEVIVDVEYQFKIKIPAQDLGRVRTVSDTVSMVQQHLATRVG
jgi:acyl carrier protein